MFTQEEMKSQRTKITLYRCECKHCNAAEEELQQLAKENGVFLEVKKVEKEGLGYLAGWKTPVVYVNGLYVTHFELNIQKWKDAIVNGLTSSPTKIVGEIVDIDCYMRNEARGESHQRCAEACIQAGVPMGLVSTDGQVYLVVEDKNGKEAYETLKKWGAERVRITGDIRQRNGIQSISVKEAEIVP